MKLPLATAWLCCGLALVTGCGGHSGSGSQSSAGSSDSGAANSISVTVNSGPPTIEYINGLFTSVTVCVPGTTTCQTIDSALVDTGSVGLRVLSSGAGGELSLSLPIETAADGNPIAECNPFIDTYTWGPVRMADILLGEEQAHSAPIQVIGDPEFTAVPDSCSSTGGTSADTLDGLGANAILGVGVVPEDCGGICAESPTAANTQNPGNVYYECPSSGCEAAAVAVENQVQNPVSMFSTDNNGIVIDLPAVSANGAPSATGTLIFGIGTESNNALGNAQVLPMSPTMLSFSTTYSGQTYTSFIDSGSNAVSFLDSNLTNISACTSTSFEGLYCPSSSATLAAVNVGVNGATSSVSFSVANAETLLSSGADFAFSDLAGTSVNGEYIDWGLPFFFGRKTFFAIEEAQAPGGSTPYVAY